MRPLLSSLLILVACGDDSLGPGDASMPSPDSAAVDASGVDSGVDSGEEPGDASVAPGDDAGPGVDAGPGFDAGPPPPPSGTFAPTDYVLEEALMRPLEDFRFNNNYRTEMGGTDGRGERYAFLHDAVTGQRYEGEMRFQGNLYGTKALVYAAFAVYFDEAASAGGRIGTEYLRDELTALVSGGVEPTCRGGGHGGHTDGTLAIALALVKRTPYVWNELSDETKERLDFLMLTLTLAGNWSQNFDSPNRNWPIVSRDTSSFMKRWNPNLVEGYVGVMLAAHYYFDGAANTNALLAAYDADEHRARAQSLGLTNIAQAWDYGRNGHTRANMETLMQRPFTYAFPPTEGVGVPESLEGMRIDFEPWPLYRSMGQRQFLHEVVNETPAGNGYQLGDTNNPFLGQLGMANEFIARDAGGERSHPKYVTKGFTTNLFLAALVLSQGDWPDNDEGLELASRIRVGLGDFLFKMRNGWYGTQAGGSPSAGPTYSHEFITDGLNFAIDIFQSYLDGSMPQP